MEINKHLCTPGEDCRGAAGSIRTKEYFAFGTISWAL